MDEEYQSGERKCGYFHVDGVHPFTVAVEFSGPLSKIY